MLRHPQRASNRLGTNWHHLGLFVDIRISTADRVFPGKITRQLPNHQPTGSDRKENDE
ncbi:hypothetical protein N9B47_03195 [bacterium]|nr:hypothetical protein [bacterium]